MHNGITDLKYNEEYEAQVLVEKGLGFRVKDKLGNNR